MYLTSVNFSSNYHKCHDFRNFVIKTNVAHPATNLNLVDFERYFYINNEKRTCTYIKIYDCFQCVDNVLIGFVK